MSKELGRKIREARESLELSQRALAKRIGITSQYLGRVEANKADGEPTEATLHALALELAVPAEELMRLAGRVPADIEAWMRADPLAFDKMRAARDRGAAKAARS